MIRLAPPAPRSLAARGLWSLPVVLLALGCRPDAGSPTYSAFDDFSAPFGAKEPLPGPDPYQEGIGRLAFGAFYEGRASQVIPVDDSVVHYYIFQDGTELTYTQVESKDRVEGLVSARLSHRGGPWWGGGVFTDAAQDLSNWVTLRISLKSSAPGFSSTTIGMRSVGAEAVIVNAADYGMAADGEWHHIVIPLIDLVDAGLDLRTIDGFLVLGGGPADAGSALLVDNFYLSQRP